MTVKQALSPMVKQWFYEHNKNVNESVSFEDTLNEFAIWFKKHEKEINESLKKDNKVYEGRFSGAFDDEDEEEEEETPKKDELFDDEKEEESVETETTSTSGSSAMIVVDNTDDDERNVFAVVNDMYDDICENKQNLAKKTPLMLLDTSKVTNMTALLAFTNLPNADLSGWDTRRVKNMEGMFYKSTFNNDSICNWKVYNCVDFKNMFLGSKFNQSLSKWTPGKIEVEETTVDPETGEKKTEKVMRSVQLPIVGAYEDEAKEMRKTKLKSRIKGFKYESRQSAYDNFMDFETFCMNEGLFDKVSAFGSKVKKAVKGLFKSVAVKLNDYLVSFINEDGTILPVVSPYTTLNYLAGGNVQGVTAYSLAECDVLNDNVPSTPTFNFNDEYYQDWKKNGREYKNLNTFIQRVKEVNESEFKEGKTLNEERVGFSGKSGGIHDIPDVNSQELLDEIEQVMFSTPGDVGDDADPALLIWGAPGVGKSTIPKSIIKSYNKMAAKEGRGKKALIVAECGDMTPDGFSLPMPTRQSILSEIENDEDAMKLAKELGFSKDELKRQIITKSMEAPKTWLPCFKPNPNDQRMNELNMKIANGYMVSSYQDDDKGGKKYVVEKTTDGGLIMFDEFFRADESIFKILMQILLNRKYGEFVIGDKWAMIACSNRPNDDDEVRDQFEQSGAVVTTRVTQINFIPDFNEWKKWAETDGHFDDLTLEFLVSEKDPKSGEYINWHNIDPDLHREGHVVHATPRTWSALMKKINSAMRIKGYSSVTEIPENRMRIFCGGTIGEEMGEKYINWLNTMAHSVLSVGSIFKDPKYDVEVPSAEELCNKLRNYISVKYASDELPSADEMINMFKFLDRKYSSAKDNIIKEFHNEMFDRLEKMDRKEMKTYRDYVKMCETRHEL